MNNVVSIGGLTKLELPVSKVLEGAKDQLDNVILIGWDKDEQLYFASTHSDTAEILLLLELSKQALLDN